jgi:hypothetical protein
MTNLRALSFGTSPPSLPATSVVRVVHDLAPPRAPETLPPRSPTPSSDGGSGGAPAVNATRQSLRFRIVEHQTKDPILLP